MPHVYDQLSGMRVLTMDFIAGIKISHADELRAAGFDTDALGATFIQAVIKQVLIDGFFHGDPHPGNLMAEPATKRLVFLDIGLVGQLDATQRVDLLGLIYAVKRDRHPGHRRRAAWRSARRPQVRRGAVPGRHRPARPAVPRVRRRDVDGRRADRVHERRVRQRPPARQQPHARDQGDDPGRGDGAGPVARRRRRGCRDHGGQGGAARAARAGAARPKQLQFDGRPPVARSSPAAPRRSKRPRSSGSTSSTAAS